ncbi:MAG: peptidylprolyl isomerase [Gammaproteobacteria bacterium]|nr:peptidylprolyl isomerase [Gammaproteobacteria bacterium]
MQASKDKVVTMHYTLTDKQGEVIDSSSGGEPMPYLHGYMNIIPGLERELEGKLAGDKLTVNVAAKDGYGERNEAMIESVPKEMFQGVEDIEPGMQFHADTAQGMSVVTVVEVGENEIKIDGNHPLAGTDLTFDVEIIDVRDASAEELEHGHVHGPGGHHHE